MVTYSTQTYQYSSANQPCCSTWEPSKGKSASTEGTQPSARAILIALDTAHTVSVTGARSVARIPSRYMLL